MAVRPWHLLSLCDGYGGTELALRSVARVRTVARVERDSYAAAVLVERMGEARLDSCPVWDDVATFDGRPWRGRVDIVAAGFPCQPWSSAGRLGGVDDDRWLWPSIARIVAEVGPRFVLLENVPGLNHVRWRRAGLQYVLQDLADLGFDAEWGLLSAEAVGAPHERERFFLVAHANRDGFGGVRGESEHDGVAWDNARRCDPPAVADADRIERGRPPRDALAQNGSPPGGPGKEEPRRRCDNRDWPPTREDDSGWDRWVAEGGPEPVLRRITDGPPNGLADSLHLGGNGLVPQCAAHAWGQLLARGGWELT